MIFYIVGGLIGISFLLLPADATTARVILYILCQAIMSGDFYLVDTYTPDMFSTDTRNFAFSFLDAVSKVKGHYTSHFEREPVNHLLTKKGNPVKISSSKGKNVFPKSYLTQDLQ